MTLYARVMVRTRVESNTVDKVPSELISYLDQRFNQLLSNLVEKKDIDKLQNDGKSLLRINKLKSHHSKFNSKGVQNRKYLKFESS